jgi:hypothetical protein
MKIKSDRIINIKSLLESDQKFRRRTHECKHGNGITPNRIDTCGDAKNGE